jgi:D-arabinose 1-dehydrogenase-like Zn-dependent alcohol dehydrogenase
VAISYVRRPEDEGTALIEHALDLRAIGAGLGPENDPRRVRPILAETTELLVAREVPVENVHAAVAAERMILAVVRPRDEPVQGHGHVDDDLGHVNADEALPPEGLEQRGRVILDFVGSDGTLALAARMVETGGAVVLVGEAGGRLRYDFRALPLEVTLTTSVWGSRADLRAVLELARRGELRWDVETLPLVQANEALERVRQGTVTGRLVLVP